MSDDVTYLSRGWNKTCFLPMCEVTATEQWLNDKGEVKLYTCDEHTAFVQAFKDAQEQGLLP